MLTVAHTKQKAAPEHPEGAFVPVFFGTLIDLSDVDWRATNRLRARDRAASQGHSRTN